MGARPTPDKPSFRQRQYAFAAHLRDPRGVPPPADVPERRMAVYRELFFNNIEGLLASGFPVLRRVLPDDRWQALVRDFYAGHHCHTPLFLEIGREFLAYLEQERGQLPEDPSFLRELAHYEWVELALAVSEADPEDRGPLDPDGDLLGGTPLLSPLAWPLRYRFPVHRIGPDFQPAEPGGPPTYLTVYRDREDRVRFLEINAATHALLELLRDEPTITGRGALLAIAQSMTHPDPESLIGFGLDLLKDLRRRGIILGTPARI